MALYPQTFIDDLRMQADILRVVQEYVPLRKAGVNWKGLCPFHNEKTPSFQVNPDKGFFHCFGCGVGGDVFKFIELHEKIGFADAVRLLAQKVGLALPEAKDDGDSRPDAGTREALLKMHELAQAYFRDQLTGTAGARARQLIKDRGISETTVEQLGYGFAPPARDGLKLRLQEQGFALAMMLQSGLVVQRESGEVVDRFRNRFIIPISRDTGSVIAFGGRAMDPEQVPKYLNSPETPIYTKGRTLYGLNYTKQAIRKVGFVVLVEGYFDFAQVFQSSAAPVVASCGTALTAQQAELLRRFTTKVVLSYDPDAAGEGAAAKSSELLVKAGFDVNVAMLDRGQDPDTFIQRNGRDAYRARLKGSRPFLDYLMDQAVKGINLQEPAAQRAFLNQMLGIAAWLPEATTRDQFADRVAHRAGITAEVIQREFRKLAASRQTVMARTELPGLGEIKKAEKALIWWLIQRPADAWPILASLGDEDLALLATRRVLELARSLHDTPVDQMPSALIQRLSEGDAQLVTRIASEPAPPANSLAECVAAMRRLRLDAERAELQRQIDLLQRQGSTEGRNDDEIARLFDRKVALLHEMEQLT